MVVDKDGGSGISTESLDEQGFSETGKQKTLGVIGEFVSSYTQKNADETDSDWLKQKFREYPDIWESQDQIEQAAEEIVSNIDGFNHCQEDLKRFHDNGYSSENWFEKRIEESAKNQGIGNVGVFANEVEHALERANENNINTILTNDFQINRQLNLDGFQAEHHHANTFNLDAVAKGSDLRAKVLEPGPGETYGKNSVDIVIYDSSNNDKHVKRYQSKYGKDSKSTEQLFKKGDYRGQRKLVPEGQAESIDGAVDTIEADGISSKPLSKEGAKDFQRQAQEDGVANELDWNDLSRKDVAKSIGKQAVYAAAIATAFQGARILGRRAFNFFQGIENPDWSEDVEEFVKTSVVSGAASGLVVAVSGGVTVAVKSGWLGGALKNTPPGRIANAVSVAIENIKIVYKLGNGEITREEALDQAASATTAAIGSIIGATKGAEVGAAIGTVFGPAGTLIGGLAGSFVGAACGSTVGNVIYEGAKKAVKVVSSTVSSTVSTVKNLVTSGIQTAYDFLFG